MSWEMRLDYFTRNPSFPFFIQFGEHDAPLPLHLHGDYAELVVVLKGSAVHRVDRETYPIAKGDVFVINGQTEHGYFETDTLRICNLMFRPALLETATQDLRKMEGFQALFLVEPFLAREYKFRSRLHLGVTQQSEIQPLLTRMVQDYGAHEPGRQTLLMARFLELVVMLSRWYQAQEAAEPGSLIQLARAVAFLETRFCEPLTLEVVAAEAGLSPRHFSRLFKASYELSPMQYLLRLRLRQACVLLREGRLNVTEVGQECGFDDSNHFSRQFHRVLGVSPRDYRRQTF